MKKAYVSGVAFLLLAALLFGCANAQEADSPWELFKSQTEVISYEAVELHIGVIQENLASNFALEMAFLVQYPNATIVYHNLTSDQFSAYLLSKESKLDLLILTNKIRDDYSKHGILVDLYETSLLDAWPEGFIDIRQQAETDGKLFGFPKRLYNFSFTWFDALAERVDAQKPSQPWSWEEFAAMAIQLPYDLNLDGKKEYGLMHGNAHINGMVGFIDDHLEQYAYQYALNGGSFQTPEFARLMELFMETYASGALNAKGVPLFKDEPAMLLSRILTVDDYVGMHNSCSFVLPPTIDVEQPGYVGWYYTFSLLSNAPHTEAALDFLRNGLDERIQSMYNELDEVFTKEIPQYYVNNDAVHMLTAFAPDQNGELTYTVSNTESYTVTELSEETRKTVQEVYESFVFMREHFLPNTGEWYRLSILWFELLPQYMNNTLSLEEMTRAMDQRMAIMQGE